MVDGPVEEAETPDKPNEYTPISDELSPQHALVQSATLLDHAAIHALHCNDFDKIMAVAQAWGEFSQVVGMVAAKMEEDEEHELTSETEVLGFRCEEEREEYEDRARKRKERKA